MNVPEGKTQPAGMKVFLPVAIGQIVSITGSALTGFALGVWVYQRTQSTTQYALILLFSMLPSLVVAPFIGALVDRWDRRRVMILSDTGAAACTVLLAVLVHFQALQVWQIYVIMAVNSILRGFQTPAYLASISLIVPKEQLGRANGILQFEGASRYLISPMLAGWLMETIGVTGVMVIDLITFVVGITTVLMVRFPSPKPSGSDGAKRKSLWREAGFGWKYIVSRPGFLALMVLFGLGNYANLMTDTVLPPMLLDITSPAALGSVLSAGGLGMLAGSMLMSAWGGPKRRILGVLGFKTLAGVGIMLIGIFQPVAWIAFATFVYYFPFPLVNGCDQAIWQSKVPPDVQGRVFATRRMIALSMTPLAYLTAGPLTDKVFKPLLAGDGALAATLGQFWGSGPARGSGLLILLMGLFIVLLTAVTALNPRVRNIETELADTVE
ncbi:MAG: MFS transporter [Chloroflexota bacterium]